MIKNLLLLNQFQKWKKPSSFALLGTTYPGSPRESLSFCVSIGKIFFNMKKIKGKYKHFKGGEYEVLGVAKHSETLEEFVVYKALYGEGDLWIRPKEMFFDEKEVDGKKVKRFKRIN